MTGRRSPRDSQPKMELCTKAATGHLVYGVRDSLYAVRFDLESLETSGTPRVVVDGVMTKASAVANFGLAENGSLVYVSRGTTPLRTLVWVDRQGREEPLLGIPPAPYDAVRISPDGRYVAVEVRDLQNPEVMVYDVERGTLPPLTVDPGQDRHPLWSPDSLNVLFSSDRAGAMNIYSRAADGTGRAERLLTSAYYQVPEAWSGDRQTLVLKEMSPGLDLHVVAPAAGGRPEILFETEFDESDAVVSPDGQHIAYISNASG